MKTVLMPEGQDILRLSTPSTATGPTLFCSQTSPRLANGRQQVFPHCGHLSSAKVLLQSQLSGSLQAVGGLACLSPEYSRTHKVY